MVVKIVGFPLHCSKSLVGNTCTCFAQVCFDAETHFETIRMFLKLFFRFVFAVGWSVSQSLTVPSLRVRFVHFGAFEVTRLSPELQQDA